MHPHEIEKLNAELSERENRIKKLEVVLRKQDDLSSELTARDVRIAELEQRTRAVKELQRELEQAAACIAELRDRAARVPDLEARIAALESRKESVAPEVPRADNLRRISGIGQGFEQSLHSIGVYRFEQIAAWTAQDIEQVAALLKINPQRMIRDGWVQEAQEQVRRRLEGVEDSDPADES